MSTMKFTIPLPPRTKKNSQQIRFKNVKGGKKIPFIAQSDTYLKYEKECGEHVKGQGLMIDRPCNVKALYYLDKNYPKIDLTNLNNALHDILVKYHLLVDDNYKVIVSTDGSRVMGVDKTNPRTEVTISFD